MPFADQLTVASTYSNVNAIALCSAQRFLCSTVNFTKTSTTFPTSEKSQQAAAPMSDAPPPLGKSRKTVEQCKSKVAAVDLLPHYSEELGASDEMTAPPVKMIMSPVVLTHKNQRKAAQERTGSTVVPQKERSNNSGTRLLGAAKTVLHATSELEDSDSALRLSLGPPTPSMQTQTQILCNAEDPTSTGSVSRSHSRSTSVDSMPRSSLSHGRVISSALLEPPSPPPTCPLPPPPPSPTLSVTTET